jgi:hypothetical protein
MRDARTALFAIMIGAVAAQTYAAFSVRTMRRSLRIVSRRRTRKWTQEASAR